jgi:hypothetical protein
MVSDLAGAVVISFFDGVQEPQQQLAYLLRFFLLHPPVGSPPHQRFDRDSRHAGTSAILADSATCPYSHFLWKGEKTGDSGTDSNLPIYLLPGRSGEI